MGKVSCYFAGEAGATRRLPQGCCGPRLVGDIDSRNMVTFGTMRGRISRRTPFDSSDASSRAGAYSESVAWRVRPRRLLIGIAAIGAIWLSSSMYARRIQVSFSLRSAKVVTSQQLSDLVYGPMGHGASLFQGAFYVGSDDSSDYVAIKHGKFAVYAYKTPRGGTPVERRMTVTTDEGKWVDLEGCFPVLSNDRPNPDEATPARRPQPHVRNWDSRR